MADELNCVRKEFADRRIPEVHEFSSLRHEFEMWGQNLEFCRQNGLDDAVDGCEENMKIILRKMRSFFHKHAQEGKS